MSFISRLNSYKPDLPDFNAKKITMEDIAKCKGSGNFTVRFIGQIRMALKTGGKIVTDKAVADFMNDHYKSEDAVDKQFKRLISPEIPKTRFEAKQLKQAQGDARRILKVFIKASESQNVRFYDTEDKMKTNLSVLKGLKAMDQFDPGDLIRAAVYEKNSGLKPSNDLKAQFSEFLKGTDLKDEEDLKAAYHDFKNKLANAAQADDLEALKKLKSFSKDDSMNAFLMSEKLNLDTKGVNAVRNMPISALLKVNSGKSTLSQAEIQKIVSNGSMAMTTYYQTKLDEKQDNPPAGSIKSDFNDFLKEYAKENRMDDSFALRNAYVNFQSGIIAGAKEGDSKALGQLQMYSKE